MPRTKDERKKASELPGEHSKIPEIRDEPSDSIPSVADMRASQKQGNEGRGLPENCEDELNEAQGHSIHIQD
jgi:hypothetical protein